MASILASGCASIPPEEYRLPVGTTQAGYLDEIRKTAALMAECAALPSLANRRPALEGGTPYTDFQKQLKAVYHFFSWQHPDYRCELVAMLRGQMQVKASNPNLPEMQAILNGLEKLHSQLNVRDAALDERYGKPTTSEKAR